MINKKLLCTLLLYLCILGAVFSKLDVVISMGFLDIASKAIWGITLLAFIIFNNYKIKKTKYILGHIFITIMFFLVQFIYQLFDSKYIISGYHNLLLTTGIVYYVIYMGILKYKINVNKILYIFSVSTCILAIIILFNSQISFSDWMSSDMYVFGNSGEKNAVGQILGLAIIIEIFSNYNNENKANILFKIVRVSVLAIALLFVQCRSAIISICVIILVYCVFVKKMNWKYSIMLFILIITVFQTNLLGVFRKALFLDKYEGTDLNTFSSGRIDLWIDGIVKWWQHPVLGLGKSYVDNFYINSLMNSGILLSIPLFGLMGYRMYKNIKIGMTLNNILIVLITVFYLCITFFEAIPPLGPGTSAMIFWCVSAFTDVEKNKY